jgi:hypothetical protein
VYRVAHLMIRAAAAKSGTENRTIHRDRVQAIFGSLPAGAAGPARPALSSMSALSQATPRVPRHLTSGFATEAIRLEPEQEQRFM